MRRLHRTPIALACAVLLATACTGTSDPGSSPDDPAGDPDLPVVVLGEDDIVLTAALVHFDDCGALLEHLRTEYAARVGPWGFGGGGWFGLDEDMADEEMADGDSGALSATAPVEGVDFSGTNVQERGVDEADFVKTDGRRIFTLSGGELVVVDVARRQVIDTITVAEGWSPELFIDGDSLLLIVRFFDDDFHVPQTVLQRIDLIDGRLSIVDTMRVEGDYLSARSVGGIARVIMRYDPHHNFSFVYPQSSQGEDTAERVNRRAVLNSTLDDWLPRYATGNGEVAGGQQLTDCADVHAPSVFSGFGISTVMSVPVSGDIDPSSSTAVTAPGDTVYASVDSLYVATTRWFDPEQFADDEDGWRRAWQERRTALHRFDISGDGSASYEASGEVTGEIHNQFSLSEHEGYLRVVTTVRNPWGDESESHVRVLEQQGDVLVEIGSVGDIGRGENVQSVRFAGDIGYVVTFRQIDPFYTVDLSVPADPRVIGELKIPGFSSYLHPISDDLVLGVGADADLEGRITGAKVSLFDVSNLADPREVSVWAAPDGWHDVGWDHRAFLWWAPERLAVVPVTVWQDFSGAVVLRVEDRSIEEFGRVSHADPDERPGITDCRKLTVDDLPSAERSEFSSDIEYLIVETGSGVLACEPGEAGMTGFDCYHDPSFEGEAARLGLLRGDESISVCWPNHEPRRIVRSIVIGDELWTLSFKGWGFDASRRGRLEVHDLATLTHLAGVDL
ncbi:beta-propeller domain-containing protein [Candidatus Poriferisodalis sp.]|uniref:beta-propeller domain-containing protein n=1 Tax=Candidatus Poriferisodalis sp. TaxID=3101277 RepID=UPI003B0163FC